MKNRIERLLFILFMLVLITGQTACNDWTDMEVVDSTVKKPWETDPALWAEYAATLRNYKQSEHFIVYARLENSPTAAASEKDFMRCLPDSLDVVTLTNADHFSQNDAEDMAVMRKKGTRVLYQVDYAARREEFPDAPALGVYLDKVVAAVETYGLDGYSFTGIPKASDPAVAEAAALIVSTLCADADKLLVFEGNPLFIAQADRDKIDYYVLDTELTDQVGDVKLQVVHAVDFCGIPASKLLLAAGVGYKLMDEKRVEQEAVSEMARRVVPFGPLCGLGIYNLSEDYYHADRNYNTVRLAIQTLNPSK